MPLGNSERSWLDEFWSLWHPDHHTDLETAKPRDLWAYDDEPKEPTRITIEPHYCHFTPHISDRTSPKLDKN